MCVPLMFRSRRIAGSAITLIVFMSFAPGAFAQLGRAQSTAGAQAIDERRFTGQESGEYLGGSVASAGDVNGDGYDDMIVGAENASGGGTDRGRAYIFFGSASPLNRLVNSADVVLAGEGDLDNFGISVSGAGDVNGDGYHDVVVGANFNDSGGANAGRAYIFYGGSSMDAIADLVLTGEAAGDQFGFSVAGAGDVNGDGYADVLVGARSNAAGGAGAGRAYIFNGSISMDAVADVTLTGTANDRLGYSVAYGGDINSDGFADVIVGAPGAGGGAQPGEAYVYFGGAAMDNVAEATLSGDVDGVDFGTAVAGVGDVNGDGFGDVAVGDPTYELSGDDAGRAYVFLGGAVMDGNADVTIPATAVNDYLGHSVGSAGDVNGDGFGDVIVGAPETDLLVPGGGAAFVFFGSVSMDATADVVLRPSAGSTYFGASVGNAGDFSGDGYADVLVGASFDDDGALNAGRVYLYMNRMTGYDAADYSFVGTGADDLFGRNVSPAGDFNGDGFQDFVIGAYEDGPAEEGRAYIFFGGPLLDTTPDVTITGETALDRFGWPVEAIGDHNGDGLADIAVGAWRYSNFDGRAYVFFGTTAPSANVAAANADVIYSHTETAISHHFGASIAAGDVNGDGFSDVVLSGLSGSWVHFGSPNPVDRTELEADLVSGPRVSNLAVSDVNGDGYGDILGGYSSADEVRLHFGGSAPDYVADVTITEETPGSGRFGDENVIGDFNGDGFGDLATSDLQMALDGVDAGRVYVFFGSNNLEATLDAANADLILHGHVEEELGTSLTAGDMNNDGFDDLIVGAYNYNVVAADAGRVLVFFGGSTMDAVADAQLLGDIADGHFGIDVAAGDLNDDGFDDVIVGQSFGNQGVPGRAHIYLSSAPAVVPRVTTIADVPDDQGGQVALKFTRSGYDYPGIDRVAQYSVQRSVPPGGGGFSWEQIATLAPTNDALYGYTAATPADQTSGSTNTYFFRVLAHGVDGEIWTSTHISASSVDNLSPVPPQSAVAAWQPGGALVTWDENITDADLAEYNVYRSLVPGFTPGPGTLLTTTTNPEYFDGTVSGSGSYYYLITAEDVHDNESAPSNEAVLDTALPITVADFSARAQGRSVVLRWRLFDDGDIAGIEVQQAHLDADNPATMDFATTEPHSVTTDAQGASVVRLSLNEYGRYAYRLLLRDNTGFVNYGPVAQVLVGLEEGFEVATPYPNPTRTMSTIAIAAREEQSVSITLYDVLGREVATVFQGRVRANQTEQIEIDVSTLSPGLYHIRVRGETFADAKQVMVR